MKVLVIGAGAREHALSWKLSLSPRVRGLFTGPGNAGTAMVGMNLPGVNPQAFQTVLAACGENSIDCVLVGPEIPLAAGIVDFLLAHGVRAVGPNKKAALLEASKTFSKAFMKRNAIPTAEAVEFADFSSFEEHVRKSAGRRLVVKKSGLAAGKGVLESESVDELIAFGRSILGEDQLLLEEYLEGWEVSIFGVSDGKDHLLLPPCADFKKAHDGDEGPNTGGMGSICPVPWVDPALMRRIEREIVAPTYTAMEREEIAYAGMLYFGLMVTREGPKVLEFNVRFGDPEAQVLLPVLDFDFGALIEAMAGGSLEAFAPPPPAGSKAALGVVIAARGYPGPTEKGVPVDPLPSFPPEKAVLFHASTSLGEDGRLHAGGGRCFTAVGLGADLRAAADQAYEAAARVRFDGGWYRRDIGRKFIETGPAARAGRDEGGGR
jgi:phosphoribosylamine--glycine ligase